MDDKTRADFWESIAEAREESCNKYIQAVREVIKNGIKAADYEALQARCVSFQKMYEIERDAHGVAAGERNQAKEILLAIRTASHCPDGSSLLDYLRQLYRENSELEARNAELEKRTKNFDGEAKAWFEDCEKLKEANEQLRRHNAELEQMNNSRGQNMIDSARRIMELDAEVSKLKKMYTEDTGGTFDDALPTLPDATLTIPDAWTAQQARTEPVCVGYDQASELKPDGTVHTQTSGIWRAVAIEDIPNSYDGGLQSPPVAFTGNEPAVHSCEFYKTGVCEHPDDCCYKAEAVKS
jgi:hypothetical protein